MRTICTNKALVDRYDHAGGFLWQDKRNKWHVTHRVPPSTAKKVAWYREMRYQLSPDQIEQWSIVKVKRCP